ncbi:hypothetical protein BTA51_26940 [Hahella sp. CCB-MM4]|nr:hypothetical protein BTA51_26940 [Hahella sp. CCB-MM4]
MISAAQRGFRQAFDWLVVRYQTRIMHAIANYIRDRDAVVDVAQETFIRAYKGISKFRSDSNFYTWLYRIAINTSYIHLNRERSKFPIVDNETSELAIANQPSEPVDEPESIVLGKELQHRLQKAIEGLPPDQRTAFLLLEENGLPYADIAEITSTPIGTVRSRIFRARESLANQLTGIC